MSISFPLPVEALYSDISFVDDDARMLSSAL
jgi:hypothetical protein